MKKKVLKVILCIVLLSGLFYLKDYVGAANTNTQMTLMKGADGLQFIDNPDIPTSANDYWSGEYLYFGLDTNKGTGRNRWKILQKENGKLFLWVEYAIYNGNNGSVFSYTSNQYQSSELRRLLNNDILNDPTQFQHSIEKDLLLETTIAESSPISFDSQDAVTTTNAAATFTNPAVEGDKLFPLSVQEIMTPKYGFFDSSRLAKSRCSRSVYSPGDIDGERYWLRSAVPNSYAVAVLDSYTPNTYKVGYINDEYNYNADPNDGIIPQFNVVPACYISTSNIAFISPAKGGKQSGAYGKDAMQNIGSDSSHEFKMTLKDTNMKLTLSQVSFANQTFSFQYEASGSTANNLSAILYDQNGDIVSYGRIKDISTEKQGTASITVPANYETDNYRLEVFAENYRGDTYTDFIGESIEVKATTPTVTEYTATFDGNGGTDGTAIKSAADIELGTLPTSTRKGYQFLGWYTEVTGGDKITDTTKMPAQNTTYYAHWELEQYQIHYELSGGTNHTDNPDSYTIESPDIDLKAPTRDGHQFEGWTYNNQTTPQTQVTIPKGTTGDQTFSANWKADQYQVTFDSCGGNQIAAQTVKYGEKVQKVIPVRSDYIFDGWYTDQNYQTLWDFDNAKVNKNLTLYAKWKPVQYTVIFKDSDSKIIKTEKVNLGQLIAEPQTPKKDGYIFQGWYVDENYQTPWDFTKSKVNNDLILYAKWQKTQCTVRFQDGDSKIIKSETVNPGQLITEPQTPKKDGYIFQGWYTDQNYQTMWDFTKSKVNSDLTLYAKWEPIQYTVVFKDYDFKILKTESVNYGQQAIPPQSPKREGYRFVGWDQDLKNIQHDMEIVAQYVKEDIVVKQTDLIKTSDTHLGFLYMLLLVDSLVLIVLCQIKKKKS